MKLALLTFAFASLNFLAAAAHAAPNDNFRMIGESCVNMNTQRAVPDMSLCNRATDSTAALNEQLDVPRPPTVTCIGNYRKADFQVVDCSTTNCSGQTVWDNNEQPVYCK